MLMSLQLQLGTLPEWLAAIGTVGALWATYVVIRRDHQRQDEQHEEALYDQALKVTCDIGLIGERDPESASGVRSRALITITNNGVRPIFDTDWYLWTPEGEPHDSGHFDELPAGAFRSYRVPPREELMQPEGYAATWSLDFADSTGRRWYKKAPGFLRMTTTPASDHPPWFEPKWGERHS
jgi:hypothetical protein